MLILERNLLNMLLPFKFKIALALLSPGALGTLGAYHLNMEHSLLASIFFLFGLTNLSLSVLWLLFALNRKS